MSSMYYSLACLGEEQHDLVLSLYTATSHKLCFSDTLLHVLLSLPYGLLKYKMLCCFWHTYTCCSVLGLAYLASSVHMCLFLCPYKCTQKCTQSDFGWRVSVSDVPVNDRFLCPSGSLICSYVFGMSTEPSHAQEHGISAVLRLSAHLMKTLAIAQAGTSLRQNHTPEGVMLL